VPKTLLDVFRVLACHEEYFSADVSEVVESAGGQPRPLQERLEVAATEVDGDRDGREDEPYVLPTRVDP
jgi:hypothetical protein